MKKQILRTTTVISMMIATISFVGCGGSDHQEGEHHGMDGEHHQMEADSTAHHMEHNYTCPMHPEVTGKEGDKCSKCGMELEMVEHEH